jgi:multiple sugar transport system ATP-binding protein
MNVSFQNVCKSFGANAVVDALNLEINDGEFVVLLGPSGCGKTTTLRMLAGLEEATSGDIFIGEERVNDLPPQRRDVAMVFQSYALYPHLSVAENIAYPLRVRKLPRAEQQAKAERAAAMLGLGKLLARRPRELSGGERQRVALARAIVREPRAYLMDEPLSNLDAKLRVQMRGELKRLQQELSTTTVYVTHDQTEAMTLAHRVAVMQNGRLQQFAAPLEIYHRPANRFVAEFVGSPAMNFIEGRVDTAERVFVNTDGAFRLSLDAGQIDKLQSHERVTLGLRPEHGSLAAAGLPAQVYVTELMGNETLVFLRVGGEKICVRAAPDFAADTGAQVNLRCAGEKALFFAPDGDAIY